MHKACYVIKRPLVSDKTRGIQGVYVFEVDRNATKVDVRNAVEKYFRVKVGSVRTLVCRGRSKKTRVGLGPVRYWKKAIVKLAPGQKISTFEGT